MTKTTTSKYNDRVAGYYAANTTNVSRKSYVKIPLRYKVAAAKKGA